MARRPAVSTRLQEPSCSCRRQLQQLHAALAPCVRSAAAASTCRSAAELAGGAPAGAAGARPRQGHLLLGHLLLLLLLLLLAAGRWCCWCWLLRLLLRRRRRHGSLLSINGLSRGALRLHTNAGSCAHRTCARRLAMLRSDLVACAPTIAVPLMRQLRALLGRRLRKKLHMHILISAELKPTATGISPSLVTALQRRLPDSGWLECRLAAGVAANQQQRHAGNCNGGAGCESIKCLL